MATNVPVGSVACLVGSRYRRPAEEFLLKRFIGRFRGCDGILSEKVAVGESEAESSSLCRERCMGSLQERGPGGSGGISGAPFGLIQRITQHV